MSRIYENPDQAIYDEIRESNQILKHVLDELREIRRELRPKPLTARIAVRFTGEFFMNSLELNVGQTSQASIVPLAADGVTNSGGTVSNVVFTFSDPSATVSLNADGVTATVTGVAPSTGPVSGSVSCTVTDTDGAVSQWTQTFTIQTDSVTPPPPQQLTQSVAVRFTTPV